MQGFFRGAANPEPIDNCLLGVMVALSFSKPSTVQGGLMGTVGNIYAYLKKGYSGHVSLCDMAFKTAMNVLFCLKFSELNAFSPLLGNASFLRRGRSGFARVKLLSTELVKAVGNEKQNL